MSPRAIIVVVTSYDLLRITFKHTHVQFHKERDMANQRQEATLSHLSPLDSACSFTPLEQESDWLFLVDEAPEKGTNQVVEKSKQLF